VSVGVLTGFDEIFRGRIRNGGLALKLRRSVENSGVFSSSRRVKAIAERSTPKNSGFLTGCLNPKIESLLRIAELDQPCGIEQVKADGNVGDGVGNVFSCSAC